MFKKLFAIMLLLGCALLAAGGWQYQQFLTSPLSGLDETRVFTVEKGWSGRRLGRELVKAGLLPTRYWFDLYIRLSGRSSDLKAGEYELEPGMKPPALLDLLVRGDVTQYRFTIIEGWTLKILRQEMQKSEVLQQTLEGVSDEEIMTRLGKPDVHPEGQFLPDTYSFPRNMSDFALLEQAHRALETVLEQEWENRDKDAIEVKTAYEALTLASIIEKETGVAEERGQISGVFNRRLKIDMKLQTDPTVIYGMGDAFDGNIRRKDLRTDTPYNTYTRKGLPPSPIALAGRDAIHAALHPEKGKTLFFVSRGDGTHQFSETVEQHNAAVRKYQLKK